MRQIAIVALVFTALFAGPLSAHAQSSKAPTRPAGTTAVTGHASPALASFDRMMAAFMAKHHPPGAAVAVARQGKLVYARGFGLANVDRHEPVQPNSLFRVASVSKPITAAAVMQLVERGKLGLDDRMVDVLGLEPTGEHPDRRLRRVTIRHLLNHAGGWDRGEAYDPMFRPLRIARAMHEPPPARAGTIVRFMMGEPLQFDPGLKSVYSNFGYCVLGRVIEKVSGQSYERYVRQHVLAPLGIHDMRIGHSLPAEKLPGEVTYYDAQGATGRGVVGPTLGQTVPAPYGTWYLEAMDAHGGWVASAPDLVRFASAFDDPARCKILSPASVHALFARPRYLKEGEGSENPEGQAKTKARARAAEGGGRYYAFGWEVVPVGGGRRNTFHSGYLDGTSTILVRRFDGLDWAVLFNSDDAPSGRALSDVVDGLMHEAADAVQAWPEINLFPQWLRPEAEAGARRAHTVG